MASCAKPLPLGRSSQSLPPPSKSLEESADPLQELLHILLHDCQTDQVLAVLQSDPQLVGGVWTADGGNILHALVEAGSAETLKGVLRLGSDLKHKDRWGATPLFKAVIRGSLDCFRVLVEDAGCDPDAEVELLQRLEGLDAANDVHTCQSESLCSWTTLALAAYGGHATLVGYILERCSPELVNLKCANGFTPLHLASRRGHADVVALLLSYKPVPVDTVTLSNEGTTPVFDAAANGHAECLRLLLAGGSDPDRESKDGLFPTFVAAREGHAECVALLVSNNATVTRTCEGGSPLHVAAKKGHVRCVKVLLRGQCPADGCLSTDKQQRANEEVPGLETPLHLAAAAGHNDVIKLLLKAGADINRIMYQEELDQANKKVVVRHVPLSIALEHRHLDTAALLVKHGADVAAVIGQAGRHMPMLTWFIVRERLEAVEFLLSRGASPLQISIEAANSKEDKVTAYELAKRFGSPAMRQLMCQAVNELPSLPGPRRLPKHAVQPPRPRNSRMQQLQRQLAQAQAQLSVQQDLILKMSQLQSYGSGSLLPGGASLPLESVFRNTIPSSHSLPLDGSILPRGGGSGLFDSVLGGTPLSSMNDLPSVASLPGSSLPLEAVLHSLPSAGHSFASFAAVPACQSLPDNAFGNTSTADLLAALKSLDLDACQPPRSRKVPQAPPLVSSSVICNAAGAGKPKCQSFESDTSTSGVSDTISPWSAVSQISLMDGDAGKNSKMSTLPSCWARPQDMVPGLMDGVVGSGKG